MNTDIEMWNFQGGVVVVSVEARQLEVAGGVVTTSERQREEDRGSYQRAAASPCYIQLGAVLGVVLALALSGCSGDGGGSGGIAPTTPPVSAPQQDARSGAEELALDAYRSMWGAYVKAGLAANPDEPNLAKYTSGSALSNLREGLANAKRDGHVIRGELGSNPKVTEVNPPARPTTVSLTDCLNTEKFLTYTSSGDPVDGEPGGRRLTRATVTNLGASEGWKVTGLGIQAVGSCN